MATPPPCLRHHVHMAACPDCMARLAHEQEARRRLEAGGLG